MSHLQMAKGKPTRDNSGFLEVGHGNGGVEWCFLNLILNRNIRIQQSA